ncbi:hypothetical protein AX774_g7034 [Zancudomyces culisetae]|uniref:Uncharacterized protein n=1 Tax=Zancudomyces culisetae TaxID=1213189 RepID=A0A1R1PCN5_ZANCU|nr:hypothetical protein AX774_g7923 [Zancudomyces culisetae]OMH79548.1 hypothetical protein AX774_g7034 [Zancudomyces culisetae]|eukprot:OMH78679.1 hypothetical protein AX774_g7923 [Zancudomyces culisetae]
MIPARIMSKTVSRAAASTCARACGVRRFTSDEHHSEIKNNEYGSIDNINSEVLNQILIGSGGVSRGMTPGNDTTGVPVRSTWAEFIEKGELGSLDEEFTQK